MEALLSCAFDNISSKELPKISKGLRQIQGVLEQICARSGGGSGVAESTEQLPPSLAGLEDDLAFREFFRLQERFEWNVATRLVTTLDRLLGVGASDDSDALIYSGLTLLQGCLLLHPPSRSIFERELYMNLLIDLLDPVANPYQTQSTALSTLICALLYRPRNIRVFEEIDGLRAIVLLLNHLQSQVKLSPHKQAVIPLFSPTPVGDNPNSAVSFADVRARLLEFVAFYLSEESSIEHVTDTSSRRRSMSIQGSPSPHSFAAEKKTRSATAKRRLLAKHLTAIKLNDCIPPTPSSAMPILPPSNEGLTKGFWKSKITPSSSSSSSKTSSGSERSRDSGFVGSSGNSWGSMTSVDDTDASVTLVGEPGKIGTPSKRVMEPKKAVRASVGGNAVLDILVDEIQRMGIGYASVNG